MLSTAVVFFLIAAFLGTFLLRAILKNQPTSKPIVFMHGSIAGLALLALVTYVAVGHTDTMILTSLALFIVAAIGGLTLFTLDMSGKPIPKMLAVGHPVLAAASIIILITYIVQTAS
jgi:hypothetical protein